MVNLNELEKIVYDFYPKGITLNDPQIVDHVLYKKFINACTNAYNNRSNWIAFINDLKGLLHTEITQLVFLSKLNPSFIAVFLTEDYERPKPIGYEPLQLVLKISVIAPVYSLYFDNLASDWDKRLIRTNVINEREKSVLKDVEDKLKKFYPEYSSFNISLAYNQLQELGDISDTNKRKPYLDECIFGLYLSSHPHNILVDKLEDIII